MQKMSGGEELPAKVIYVQNMLPFDMPTGMTRSEVDALQKRHLQPGMIQDF